MTELDQAAVCIADNCITVNEQANVKHHFKIQVKMYMNVRYYSCELNISSLKAHNLHLQRKRLVL